MLNTIAYTLAALIAVAVTANGSVYLSGPQRVLGTFGLKPPASDPDTLAWLRLKGVRDVGCGIAVLALMLAADRRSVGIAMLALSVIPLGDMLTVLGSGGSRTSAYFVHGATCVVMLLAGLVLIHVL